MSTSFLNQDELVEIGFKKLGKDTKISRYARFYNPKEISIGSYSRVDDFCVISTGEGGIEIGRNVHISCYASLIGKGRIIVGDFVAISSRTAIYSSNDDYSGEFMTNPTLNEKYTNVNHDDVTIGKHVVIGAGSIILPGSILEEGSIVGALSLVKGRCEAFSMYGGIPVKFIRKRSERIKDLEKLLFEEEQKNHLDLPENVID